jgi:hypothetical protein
MQQAIIDINGIAHIQIAVSRFELCVSFYEKLSRVIWYEDRLSQ